MSFFGRPLALPVGVVARACFGGSSRIWASSVVNRRRDVGVSERATFVAFGVDNGLVVVIGGGVLARFRSSTRADFLIPEAGR